jgi:hypothetical protein
LKYPLTEQAKDTARELVAAWNAELVPQLIPLFEIRNDGGSWHTRFKRTLEVSFEPPHLAIWLELAQYGLIRYIPDQSQNDDANFEVLLLQELRKAVENDFEVSDYFLTMNAVGNIIVNSTTGPVQGVGYNTGIVHQNVEQLADYMSASLGQAFLDTQTQLKAAIDDLRTTVEVDQQSKLGKVISELGNCLQHGANAAAVVVALNAAAPFLQRIFGG